MSELIDQDRFGEMYRDFPASVVAEVVATFRTTTPPMIERVVQAARDGDAELVAQAAHRVKGGCMAIGAIAVERIAGLLERDGLAGADTQALVTAAHALEHAWAQTDAELARCVVAARD